MRKTRCYRVTTSLMAGSLFALAALTAKAQIIYTFELLADTRSGFTDLSLFPSINHAGTVAFRGELSGGSSGIFTANGGAPQLVVDNTGSFSDFGASDPKINATGDIVFFANQSSGGSGIFVRNGGGISTIAETSGEFSSGDSFAAFGSPSINSSGTVAFTASSFGGQLGVFTNTAGGTPSRVSPASTFSAVAGEVYINGNGRVGVVATTPGGETQVLTALPPGDFNVAVSTSSPLFSAIESVSPYLTSDGLSVVILATREDTGERGIFRVSGSDVTTLVDSSGGFQDFNDFALAADGSLIAFSAVTDDGRIGIFNGDDPLLNRVVVTGDLLPFGAELREVSGLSFGESGLNDAGQITFYATFTDNPFPPDPGFAAIFRANPIPEPGVNALLLCGGGALVLAWRRRAQSVKAR